MSEAGCLFCRIVSRSIPADIVGETQDLLAFKDIHPQAPTHLLIIPTEHIPTVTDLTEAHTGLIGNTVHLANRLAQQFQLTQGGYRLVINTGIGAGQSVFHFHMHLLGGRTFRWPPG